MNELQSIIEVAFERRADITPRNVDSKLKDSIEQVIDMLDKGQLRVAEKIDGDWVTHQWLKKAVLLSFRIEDNFFIKGGYTNYFDKVPSKFADYNSRDFRDGGFRVVPPAAARRGSFIGKNVVLMPSSVTIGAYID
ncbi:MAG: 2,3,4,5-tetrahydropyridine-2,6-dicarboxylate N-succinyltransferase, partial [Sulfuricella sp.]|nr:2,3,4,5-tetrahydropyridine-2,6-dicarboxylate N-succinyltransferase [Sulfuricella sp.]